MSFSTLVSEIEQFRLVDVLSVMGFIIVSPRGDTALYELLSFMTGEQLSFSKRGVFARTFCRGHLAEQFPQLVTSDVLSECAELHHMWTRNMRNTPEVIPRMLSEFCARQISRFGETLLVQRLPPTVWEKGVAAFLAHDAFLEHSM